MTTLRGPRPPRTKIYSGLTLGRAEVTRLLPSAHFSKPIEREDILRDIDDGYQVIAIIDGAFGHTLAVAPSEIMDALRCGLRVYGCSSMGALRAAELLPFGMIGHGKIFEHICATPIFRDDFLGQDFEGSSVVEIFSFAHMDLHFYCEDLVLRGKLTPAENTILLETSSMLHFSQRTKSAMVRELKSSHPKRPKLLKTLLAFFSSGWSQKRKDAKSLLRKIPKDLQEISRANQNILTLQRASRMDHLENPKNDWF